MLATVPSKDINDVLTGANVLGDVAVRFSKESGGLIKNKYLRHIRSKHHFFFKHRTVYGRAVAVLFLLGAITVMYIS